MRTISKKGLDLIKEFEGCYLKAYQDCVNVWTIGYGITNSDKAITNTTIKKGLTISTATAEKWLKQSLEKKYLPLVLKYDSVYGTFTQSEIDALVSFCYNIGSIEQLTARGVRSRKQIADAILKYNKAGGVAVQGLTDRRFKERNLFRSETGKKYTGDFPTLPARGYLKRTDKGEEVAKLQSYLKWYKSYSGEIDGDFGKQTEKAVKQFQRDFDLSADGLFGKGSLAKALTVKL